MQGQFRGARDWGKWAKLPRSAAGCQAASASNFPLSPRSPFVFNNPMEELISAERVQRRIVEMAKVIAADFCDRPITIVGVLTGCIMFLADLVRHLDLPLRIDLIQASSYRGAVTKPGVLKIAPELVPDVHGRHVLLLDDILDTGQTLSHLKQHLQELGAASVRVAVLLRKLGRQQVQLEPDYCGFDIPDRFVVGYGLDYNDEYRHLPYVAVLPHDGTTG
jgi:hypoxanthine phosphoribosyltransferase